MSIESGGESGIIALPAGHIDAMHSAVLLQVHPRGVTST